MSRRAVVIPPAHSHRMGRLSEPGHCRQKLFAFIEARTSVVVEARCAPRRQADAGERWGAPQGCAHVKSGFDFPILKRWAGPGGWRP
jgi:hypothetical protein